MSFASLFKSAIKTGTKSADDIATEIATAVGKIAGKADAATESAAKALIESIQKGTDDLSTMSKKIDDLEAAAKKGSIGELSLKNSKFWKDNATLFENIGKASKIINDIKLNKVADDALELSQEATQMVLAQLKKTVKTGTKLDDGVFNFFKLFKDKTATAFAEDTKYMMDAMTRGSSWNRAMTFVKDKKWVIGIVGGVASLVLLCVFTGKANPIDALTTQFGKTAEELAKIGGDALGTVVNTAADAIGTGANTFLDSSGLGGLFKGMGTYIMIGVAVVFMNILFMMLK